MMISQMIQELSLAC